MNKSTLNVTQSTEKTPNDKPNFSEYDQMLSEVQKYWKRGDALHLAEKLSSKGIEGRKTKSPIHIRKRIGYVLNEEVNDVDVLIEMFRHVQPRKKLLRTLVS